VFAGNIGNLRFIRSIFLFTFQEDMAAAVEKCQKANGIADGKCGSSQDRLKEYRDFHKWLF
jgi:hypothetical protein